MHANTSPETTQLVMRPLRWVLVNLVALSVFSGCQQEMAYQPSYAPLEENPFFQDGAASRKLIAGTVSRGNLKADDALHTGKVNGEFVSEFPISITEEVIRRGQNRFQIYCSPCHSQLGDGNGMIVQRGVKRPPSFHEERLTTAPVGHFYDVITNGFGQMYSYDHIPVTDRWAIVSYVRTLQIAHQGTIDDVPQELKAQMEALTTGTLPAKTNKETAAKGGAH